MSTLWPTRVDDESREGKCRVGRIGGSCTPAFLFAGHGSQSEGMAEELVAAHPVFREGARTVRCRPGGRIQARPPGHPLRTSGDPLSGAPCRVARLGKLQQALPPGGGMLAVGASEERVTTALATGHPGACIAAVNGPASVVIAGERAEIDRLRTRFEAEGVRTSVLNVTVAFHSPQMGPILDDLLSLARSVRVCPPSIPYVSCLTGALAYDELRDGEYWVRHLSNPIRFLDGMRALFGLSVGGVFRGGHHRRRDGA